MTERRRLKEKARSRTISSAPAPQWRPFGQPQVLEGEDAAAYDQLLARIRVAIKPVDIIEEMFIADVMSLQWEVLRWRRLQTSLIQTRGCEALENFLVKQIETNYDLHEEHFKGYLEEIFRINLPDDRADSAEALAAKCAPNTVDAGDELDKVLGDMGTNLHAVLRESRERMARELMQAYVQRDPDTVALINKLLTAAGASIDAFMADVVVKELDDIERIDRLTSNAENRRNASLREIEERRAIFGQTLRRSLQNIEDAELKTIEELSQRKTCSLTSDRKIKANRANARTSTGPKTSSGRARSARNALRHGLSLPVCSVPALCKEVEALAREIAGTGRSAQILELARRVAEAEVDLLRVREARHRLLSRALSDPYYYESRENARRKVAFLSGPLRPKATDFSWSKLGECQTAVPQGPEKFALILSQEQKQFLALDRYERGARFRRKIALQAFDEIRRLRL